MTKNIIKPKHQSEPRFSQDFQDAQDYFGQKNPVNLINLIKITVLTFLCAASITATAQNSGTCGDNLYWTLNIGNV
jgi:hypothetical protein